MKLKKYKRSLQTINASQSVNRRGSNWTIPEDEALCVAWLNTSQDATLDEHYRMQTLYKRVHERFLEICTEEEVSANPELRAPTGIKARWHQINKLVSKFVSYLSQVQKQPQSDDPPKDLIKQSMALFAATEKSSFTLMHCFVILENAPKWQQYNAAKVLASQKRAATESDDSSREERSVPEAVAPAESRSIEQKPLTKSRKVARGSPNKAELRTAKANAVEKRLEYSRQKAQALTRMANHAIMSTKLDGLSETAREYYMLEQQRILDETRELATNRNHVPSDELKLPSDNDDDDYLENDPLKEEEIDLEDSSDSDGELVYL